MLCQRCNKNEATIHITEVSNSKHRENHLCEQCAEADGSVIKNPVTINQLLSSFIMAHSGATELAELTCSECGVSFLEFRQHGLLGCPNDYKVFSQPLDSLLTSIHGQDTHHVGKVPSRGSAQQKKNMELLRLRRDLTQAVEAEKYEKAAQLRDLIKEIQSHEVD